MEGSWTFDHSRRRRRCTQPWCVMTVLQLQRRWKLLAPCEEQIVLFKSSAFSPQHQGKIITPFAELDRIRTEVWERLNRGTPPAGAVRSCWCCQVVLVLVLVLVVMLLVLIPMVI